MCAHPFQNGPVVLRQNLGIKSRISIWRIIMNKLQLLSIMFVFFKTCLKYLLMNRDLQFCTIHGGLELRQLAAILSVLDRLIANRLTEIFPSFCLKVDFVYLFTIRLTLGIVPIREITTKIEKTCLFSRQWPWAYFLNGPNAAASTAPTSIRHWSQLANKANIPLYIGRWLSLISGTSRLLCQARVK